MLDNLYENIGGKIKSWAKGIFIVESIGFIIGGIVLALTASDYDDPMFIFGILTVFLGPFMAWVGSWLMYAFGELVEDVGIIRENVDSPERYSGISSKTNEEKPTVTKPAYTPELKQATQCACGEMFYGRYCPICGKSAVANTTKNETATNATSTVKTTTAKTTSFKSKETDKTLSYKCVCGERYYGNVCPNCGRKR